MQTGRVEPVGMDEPTTPPPAPTVSHVGLCVSDLDRALRFWCDGLGFRADERFELTDTMMPGLDRALEVDPGVQVVSQFIRSDGFAIELLHYASPDVVGAPSTQRNQLGLTHLCCRTPDLEASVARLVEHGGTVVESTRATLGVDLVFVADPDGNRVELMQS